MTGSFPAEASVKSFQALSQVTAAFPWASMTVARQLARNSVSGPFEVSLHNLILDDLVLLGGVMYSPANNCSLQHGRIH